MGEKHWSVCDFLSNPSTKLWRGEGRFWGEQQIVLFPITQLTGYSEKSPEKGILLIHGL